MSYGDMVFLKLVIVYVLRYDFLDTFRLRVYKSKKSSFERKIQAGKPGFFFVFFSLLVIFFSLRFGLFDTSIDQALHDSPKKDSFKNAW